MVKNYSLCIVSYQPIILEGMLRSFKPDPQATIVGVGTSAEQAQALVGEKRSDVLLLDCAREERRLACIQRIRKAAPGTRVVILTGNSDVDHAVRALESGVFGYLTTRATGNEIVDGVKRVMNGEKLVCSTLAMNVMNRIKETSRSQISGLQNRLTTREEKIADLLMRGRTNRQIADLLGVSERTVKHYLSGLMQRYSVRNRTELVLALPRAPSGHDRYVN